MRFSLRTLLIVLAVGPPVLAGAWSKFSAWEAERARKAQRIYWMISPTMAPADYSRIPKTVGEFEALGGARRPGIDGVRYSATKR